MHRSDSHRPVRPTGRHQEELIIRTAIQAGVIATLGIAAMSLDTPVALGYGDGDSCDRGGVRAASYVNPDIGTVTENPDVDRDSSSSDQRDQYRLSDSGTAKRNLQVTAAPDG